MNFTTFSYKLYRMIGEQVGVDMSIEPVYSGDLIRDGVNMALVSIMPWHPRLATADLGPAGATSCDLPTDCYVIDGIYDPANKEMLEKVTLYPGFSLKNITSENGYIAFETGKIAFINPIPSGGFIAYYMAYWPELSDQYEAEEIGVPDYLIPALLYYVAAHCLQSAFSNLPQISAFKNRIDSGNPEHNPYAQVIKFFLSMFQGEMNRHSPYQRLSSR